MYTRESRLPFAVYAYAASVFGRGRGAACAGGGMTREEAESMLGALAGTDSAGPLLGGGDVAGLMLGAAELFFEYDAERGALACGALVYRFRKEPRPGVLETFFEEASGADFGTPVYRAETRALLLSRTYTEALEGEEFTREMKRLAAASLGRGAEVLERVATRHERGV